MNVTPQQFGMQLGQQAKQASLGNAVRGLGIQAGRAGLRLGNAAKPLVDEATSMANTGAQRLGQTMFGNPVRSAVSGAGLATAGLAYGDHLAAKNQAKDQAKNQAMLMTLMGKKASLLPALGGGLGAGVGGLAGAAGGGLLGGLLGTTVRPVSPALTGLGLLAGGAAGMGAGAYMGGNIGSDIGRSFSKKKKSPESAEKEESAEEAEDKKENKDKEAAFVLPSAGIGAGLGAITAPSGHRMEGVGRGATKGTGTGIGATIGAPIGALGALALALRNPSIGKKMLGPSNQQLNAFKAQLRSLVGKAPKANRPGYISPENKLRLGNTLLAGGVGGAVGGGALGYAGADALLGKPTWETNKQADSFSALAGNPAVKRMLQRSADKLTHAVKTTGANPGVVLPPKPQLPAAAAAAAVPKRQNYADLFSNSYAPKSYADLYKNR